MSYETNRIDEFLTTFAKAAGLSDLALSDEGSLFLSVDGAALTLRHFPATDDLVIASIAATPETGSVQCTRSPTTTSPFLPRRCASKVSPVSVVTKWCRPCPAVTRPKTGASTG